MFCEKCGNELLSGVKNCQNCGFPIEYNQPLIKENFGYGSTIEEAVSNAKKVFTHNENIKFEILELPSRNLFNKKQAKVRAYLDI